jgi:hypothetical protein
MHPKNTRKRRSRNIVDRLGSRSQSSARVPIQNVRELPVIHAVRNQFGPQLMSTQTIYNRQATNLHRGWVLINGVQVPIPPDDLQRLEAAEKVTRKRLDRLSGLVTRPESYFWDDQYERSRRREFDGDGNGGGGITG